MITVLNLKPYRPAAWWSGSRPGGWAVLAVAVGVAVGGCAGARNTTLHPRGETGPAAPGGIEVERRAYLMGTTLEGRVVSASRETGIAALEAAFSEIRRLEAVLSSWTGESEIGRINAASPGTPVGVSGELWALLREVAVWADSTGGAFDPAVGALIDAWDLRGEGRRPSGEALDAALGATGLDRFRIDGDSPEVTRLDESAWLDSGAFGKGAALRSVETVLRTHGVRSAYLDFGGQILVFGPRLDGERGWEIAVAHPERRGEGIAALRLAEGSVATSAQSERYVEMEGTRLGHVVDPRTGLPVAGGRSVTVIAQDPMVADILATALLVMGSEEGGEWAEGLQDVGVLFVEEKAGGISERWNPAFESFRVDLTNRGETEYR